MKDNHKTRILNFEPFFAEKLPDTHALIMSANLTVHSRVSCITLHGSRGLAGGYHPTSDIDLCLIVDVTWSQDMEHELDEVLNTTLSHWQGSVEPDLAVVFDIRNCQLACFEQRRWDERFCQLGGIECFGLYKTQKGFSGLVANAGVQVKLMYPCLKIWQRQSSGILT